MEYGHEISILECKEFVLSRLPNDSFEELSRYKLDLAGVQEVRLEGSGTEPAGEYTFFYGKGNENHELGTGFLCIRESYQQLRGLSFFSDRMSYILLRGRWCHIIVLNVHAPNRG
jgi:hypothetical protein